MRTSEVHRSIALLVVALVILGCSAVPRAGEAVSDPADPFRAVPHPEGCADLGIARPRCDRLVAWAMDEAGVGRAQVAAVELLRDDPTCGGMSEGGEHVLCIRSGAVAAFVRLHLADGRTSGHLAHCGVGSGSDPLCVDHPELRLVTVIGGGYHDVPCAGEPPDGCATPPPTIAPDAAAEAVPLAIAELDIPVDRLGPHEIEVGTARLANGILTEAGLAFADPTPSTFWVVSGDVELSVRSAETGEPIGNIHEFGWHEGVIDVRVFVRFDVEWFEPGAVLGLRDLRVG